MSARQDQIEAKAARLAKMRGRAHTKTRKEWMAELGVKSSAIDFYLVELEERAKPARAARVNPERQERVRWVAANSETMTRAELAKELGVHVFSVDRHLSDAGVRAKKETNVLDPEDWSMMRDWLRKPIVGRTHQAALRSHVYERHSLRSLYGQWHHRSRLRKSRPQVHRN